MAVFRCESLELFSVVRARARLNLLGYVRVKHMRDLHFVHRAGSRPLICPATTGTSTLRHG